MTDLPTYAELQARQDGPPGSSWGLFGPHDEIGALNLVGPDEVVAASRLVRKGAVFSLDYPVNAFEPTERRPAAVHTVITMAPDWRDDYLDRFYLQQTSQVDGLRHVRHPAHGFYGGIDPDRVVADDPTIGVNHWADRGIVGRGVLIDVARHRERAGRPLDHAAGEPITVDLLDETLAAQGVGLSPGDLLLVRTGYPSYLAALGGPHPAEVAGLEQSHEMLAWLWDHRIPLAASDNTALECSPVVPTSPFFAAGGGPGDGLMHPELIALLGMVVGELWRLDELAADCADDGVYELLLVVKPLNVVGGVGSPPNATAVK
ncbi:MAG TPA: cyclase family protein [Acidimicrobiales bacterium]|nr:cyclase family protein [Acidimicrobiales bacterium]